MAIRMELGLSLSGSGKCEGWWWLGKQWWLTLQTEKRMVRTSSGGYNRQNLVMGWVQEVLEREPSWVQDIWWCHKLQWEGWVEEWFGEEVAGVQVQSHQVSNACEVFTSVKVKKVPRYISRWSLEERLELERYTGLSSTITGSTYLFCFYVPFPDGNMQRYTKVDKIVYWISIYPL